MKKKFFVSILFMCFVISMNAMPRGFWELYIMGPDTSCDMNSNGTGTWTIEDTYDDPVDPNNQYEWFINDAEARDEGYPSWSFGRPAYDYDRQLTTGLSWGEGNNELSDILITCKITSNGQTRYEGITVSNCY